jgi:hypothetical protein
MKIRLTGVVALALAGAALLLGGRSSASAATLTTTDHPLSTYCYTSGQLCSPPAQVTVETLGVLKARFTAAPTHCSSARVYISLGGVVRHTSPFLAAGQSTQMIDLGPVPAGTYTIQVQAEGTIGGCNSGHLSGWGGTLRTEVSSPNKAVYQASGPCSLREPCQPYSVPVTTTGLLKVRFTVNSGYDGYCGLVRMTFRVAGRTYTHQSTLHRYNPSTGVIDMGPVPSGTYNLYVGPQESWDGCGWRGTLEVFTL